MRANMITLQDCIALCGLTEEQVLAIAEHEHLPEIAATALAQYLSKQEHGMEKIRDMIVVQGKLMSMSAYYRAQAQRCLALSRAFSDRRQGAQLAFMANRYFERAE